MKNIILGGGCFWCIELFVCFNFFFQAEDGIRDLVRSRGLGDVYKIQDILWTTKCNESSLLTGQASFLFSFSFLFFFFFFYGGAPVCLLYTSDAADDLLCVALGGRRIIKKKKKKNLWRTDQMSIKQSMAP